MNTPLFVGDYMSGVDDGPGRKEMADLDADTPMADADLM